MKTEFSVVIPARLKSTRLPEKLLQKIGDKSVLHHSFLAAKNSGAKKVIIAVDDEVLLEHANSFTDQVVLTKNTHESGTDRLAELVSRHYFKKDDIIVNLQADEPFMPPDLLASCALCLSENKNSDIATLALPLLDKKVEDPNIVKVILNHQQEAIYFSRASIPFNRDNKINVSYYHHLGIYAYRSSFLERYQDLPSCLLEETEKLEQLRAIYYGYKIAVKVVDVDINKGIDTKEDLLQARAKYEALSNQ